MSERPYTIRLIAGTNIENQYKHEFNKDYRNLTLPLTCEILWRSQYHRLMGNYNTGRLGPKLVSVRLRYPTDQTQSALPTGTGRRTSRAQTNPI